MIWAQSRNGVIGRDGDLPWRLREDMQHFKRTTGSDAVIHGRTSWEALPPSFRPLPGRRNIVLTRQPGYAAPGAEIAHSLAEALALLDGADTWICGGGEIYAQAMPVADVLVVSEIDIEVDGDTFAPEIGPGWSDPQVGDWIEASNGMRFRVLTYRREMLP
ncbi:dihydrofolate reductase [Pseudactinotalea terrae]|uniref:dihydrofolate reductase n=1 Tax=Pseudactinotalea terrae TaxID=1743262 RepID=UPI0018835659|nr:dihydrofolate reductase [Pseudactinotalea terrae]